MKTKSLVLTLVFSACSSSSPTGTTGGTTAGTTGGTTTGGTTGSSCPTALCGGNCCASTDTCISNSCCSAAQTCGTACCASTAVCFTDGAGNKSCATLCTDSSQCPTATNCCTPFTNGQSACLAFGVAQGQACRCTTSAECSSGGACAPLTDTTGAPVGPFVCKPNDGALYDGCNGLGTTCSGNGCCVQDTNGNYFCTTTCTNASMCGNAKCNTYDFNKTTCSGPTACGP
jgi:hypothetical protein